MKQFIYIAAIVGCLGGALSASNFDVGVSGSDEGIDGFSLSIGNFYGIPREEVVVIERSLPRDDMSVVYFLANKSHHDARYITDLRLRGASWWDISVRLGLNPHALYVVDGRRYYGSTYGYYKGKKHRLRDAEIANYVNVHFLSEYHHISPSEVIHRRHGGENYHRIHEYYRGKKDHPQYREDKRKERRDDRRKEKKDNGEKGHGNPHER